MKTSDEELETLRTILCHAIAAGLGPMKLSVEAVSEGKDNTDWSEDILNLYVTEIPGGLRTLAQHLRILFVGFSGLAAFVQKEGSLNLYDLMDHEEAKKIQADFIERGADEDRHYIRLFIGYLGGADVEAPTDTSEDSPEGDSGEASTGDAVEGDTPPAGDEGDGGAEPHPGNNGQGSSPTKH